MSGAVAAHGKPPNWKNLPDHTERVSEEHVKAFFKATVAIGAPPIPF